MDNNHLDFPLPDEESYGKIEEVAPIQQSSRKKSTAILLAFFCGVWGVHSFYLGFTQKGVFQILSSFCGLSVFWALIDIVQMLFSSEYYDADGKPLV